MKASLGVALLLSVFFAQQPPAAPASGTARSAAEAAIAQAAGPGDCVTALRTFTSKRQAEVRPPTGWTSEALKKIDDERIALAQTCVARFENGGPSQLAGLAELFMEAGMSDRAAAAIGRALEAPTNADTRAATLATAITLGLREPKGDERNARLEKLLDELDANPAATLAQKWTAHNRLESYYRGDDIDAGIIKHAKWMMSAARNFTPDQRKQYGASVVQSQINMAEALAGQAMNDEALAMLRKTAEEWKDIPRIDERINPSIERYSLVGTPAASVKAAHWLNAPSDTTELAMSGKVTLLEFTAHWCGPCRESYPGVNRLREQYGAKGFRVVMATQFYGYISMHGKTERDLTPEQEFKRDAEYFADYKLDVPIAVADRSSSAGRDPNDLAYKVSGIPQIHLIDKHGKIRLIMIGYDEANEPKLAEMIAKLLAES